MKIEIVTPAPSGSVKGNRVTADRWAGILGQLGHQVKVEVVYQAVEGEEPPDLLIALHAKKSAESVARFTEGATRRRSTPTALSSAVVVALTGTDLYRDIHDEPQALQSLESAWRLVALQPRGIDALAESLRPKVRVIVQSIAGPRERPAARSDCFEVCVSGHLRPVKDPFRTAEAVRSLPPSSRVQVTHLGAALEPAMEERARREMAENPRYRWLGGVSRREALQTLWRSRLLVLSSELEGGANVVCEALAGSVPVLSSRIEGSLGLLGEDYPGYFEVGDTAGLSALLQRAEEDVGFYQSLCAHVARRKDLVDPARELEAWRALLAELDP